MTAKDKAETAADADLFVSQALIERMVELADGRKHKFWFKEAPAVDFRRFQIAETSKDEAVRAGSMFHLIAISVCNPDGTQAMSAEKAMTLKPAVTNLLIAEILSINSMGVAAKNDSPPRAKNGSGT